MVFKDLQHDIRRHMDGLPFVTSRAVFGRSLNSQMSAHLKVRGKESTLHARYVIKNIPLKSCIVPCVVLTHEGEAIGSFLVTSQDRDVNLGKLTDLINTAYEHFLWNYSVPISGER